MKEITLRVPDQKLKFFLELFTQLGVEVYEEHAIPEEHIAVVRERISESQRIPETLISWEEVESSLKLD